MHLILRFLQRTQAVATWCLRGFWFCERPASPLDSVASIVVLVVVASLYYYRCSCASPGTTTAAATGARDDNEKRFAHSPTVMPMQHGDGDGDAEGKAQ